MHIIHGVHPGDYVTDGERLAEIVEVGVQGFVQLRDCVDESVFGMSMAHLRTAWSLVPLARREAA